MNNNFKSSAKVYSENNYSEFSTVFRIQHKEWDTDFVPKKDAWKDIIGTWSKVCIEALEARMDSCVSMLFRNRDNIVKANEHQVVFKKNNGLLHSFNHSSFKAMEQMVADFRSGNWDAIKENKLGCVQLLKALYWVEDRKEVKNIGFGELITTLFELSL